MLYTLRFSSSKCSLFHNANLFGSCIIHILYTGCAKIKKNNSGAKRLIEIIIIFVNCNWVVTRWQGYFTRTQNMKLVTNNFKSGGPHEKNVVATWNLGNHLSICF